MRPTLSAHNLEIDDFDFYAAHSTTSASPSFSTSAPHSNAESAMKLGNEKTYVDLDSVLLGKFAGSELHFRGLHFFLLLSFLKGFKFILF